MPHWAVAAAARFNNAGIYSFCQVPLNLDRGLIVIGFFSSASVVIRSVAQALLGPGSSPVPCPKGCDMEVRSRPQASSVPDFVTRQVLVKLGRYLGAFSIPPCLFGIQDAMGTLDTIMLWPRHLFNQHP